ncbi:MAG: PA14 domain-containing protein, partial [Anaerolineae bacterium]
PNLGGDVVLEETIEGPILNETWDPGASPGEGLPENEFSVRYTTEYTFEDANYDFRLTADDGARLYINGALVIDAWEEGDQAQTFFASRVLPIEDGTYTVTVEFYELYGLRFIETFWEETTDLPSAGDEDFVVPGSDPDDDDDGGGDADGQGGGGSGTFTGPADPTAPYDAWRVRYWDNISLDGDFIAEDEFDAEVGDDAGRLFVNNPPGSAPIPEVGEDDWSARYEINFRVDEDTNMRFRASADDGVRVAINGAQVIDAWEPVDQAQDYFKDRVIPVPAGTYTIGVEYYEAGGNAFVEVLFEETTDLPAAPDENFFIPGTGEAPPGGGDDGDQPGTGEASTPPPDDFDPGLFVDQFDPTFIWSGSQEWSVGTGGESVNGSYIYTDNSKVSFLMYGRWNLRIPQSGDYDVYVFIPDHGGTATELARYRVFHSGVLSDEIRVDQEEYGGEYVFLGRFFFDAGGSQFVYLNDLTFEEAGTTDVLFDAVQVVAVDD